MEENTTQQSPAAPAPAPQPAAPAPSTWRDYLMQFRDYIVAVVVALLVVGGVSVWRAQKQKKVEESGALLAGARSAKDLESLLSQFPGTPAAQVARLTLAKAQYDSGDYATARSTYEQFQKDYPNHPVRDIAVLGVVHCEEAIGKTDAALASYDQFLTAHTNHYLQAVAVLGKARCLEQLSRLGEAKAAYEDFIAANPKSSWLGDMERGLLNVNRELARAPAP
jgi:tetratricopeptide (TPR) repeat protein